jgi:hypothetical protein
MQYNPQLFFISKILRIKFILIAVYQLKLCHSCNQGCGSGLTSIWIRIRIQHISSIRSRIHKVIEAGSNADPDPQEDLIILKKFLRYKI